MKKTVEEIIDHLHAIDDITNRLGYEDYNDEEIGLGEIKLVEDIGGYEGAGEYMAKVYHFVEHDVYLKMEGYYSSWDGSEWESGFTHVEPKEVMVIQYKEVKK